MGAIPNTEAPWQEADGTWSVIIRGKLHAGLTNVETWRLYDGDGDKIELTHDRVKTAFYER